MADSWAKRQRQRRKQEERQRKELRKQERKQRKDERRRKTPELGSRNVEDDGSSTAAMPEGPPTPGPPGRQCR